MLLLVLLGLFVLCFIVGWIMSPPSEYNPKDMG